MIKESVIGQRNNGREVLGISDGLCTMLIQLLHQLLIFRCRIFLPYFHTYREKGNALIEFQYLMHCHQIVETFLVSNIFRSKLKYIYLISLGL